MRVRIKVVVCFLYLLGAGGQAFAATLYSMEVDGVLPGPPSGTYFGSGDAALDGGIMTYSHSGNIVISGGFEASVTYTGSFDLLAETGSVIASDCLYISGIASLCDSLIQDVPIALNVSFISATSGSLITVIADDGQGEFTHSFAQVVPLPAAVWLFGSALAGLGFLKRKQIF